MTSLDVFDLQSLLSTAKNNGCKIAILETSSQGLDQHRFEGIEFDVAVLTNITHDHLDYHGGMEPYAESKKKLFRNVLSNSKQNKFWIFPADDSYGRKRFEEMPFDKKINYSTQASSILKATQIIEYLDHTEFVFSYLGKLYRSSTKLLWAYNVNNILAAIAVAIQIWLDISTILPSIEAFDGVEGRLQAKEIKGVNCFVDFAHTPDALEKTLSFLAGQKEKKNWLLFLVALVIEIKKKDRLCEKLHESIQMSQFVLMMIQVLKIDWKFLMISVILFKINHFPQKRARMSFLRGVMQFSWQWI